MPVEWMEQFVLLLADATDAPLYAVKGVMAILLVCALCGMVGSMVVGNRMAFFSDAMAHSAFAGVALGGLIVLLGFANQPIDGPVGSWLVPMVMVLFGAVVGVGMVYLREQTSLASDTVIGVAFAFAIGFGAMLFRVLREKSNFNPDSFLFGNLLFIPELDLVFLALLVLIVGALFAWRYNELVFASFSPSLARTRGIPLRINNYLFIVLLALVVNLSIKVVGALLINALLIVPAAAASNVAGNLSRMFWLTVAFCIGCGLFGWYASAAFAVKLGPGPSVKFGPSGTIVVVCVAVFFLTAVWAGLRRRSLATIR